MPEPVYSIRLFYGDMKFTNDYSNVLRFNEENHRDRYFERFALSFEIQNTETNRVMFDGGSVKLALDLSVLDKLDKINYCYINYALVDGNNYEQYRRYYFINSYEIVSSNEDLTVVEFVLEYDVWQNNQFDFTFRESNIERMHVDRWNRNNNYMKYTRPMLDAIESNAYVNIMEQIEVDETQHVKFHGSMHYSTKIIWVMVTAIHTFDTAHDQMLYHFFPVIYTPEDMTFSYTDSRQPDYFYQNSINVFTKSDGDDSVYANFPSLQSLDSAYLAYACGNKSNDVVEIVNVQFFNWLPLKVVYEDVDLGDPIGTQNTAVIKTLDDIPLRFYGGVPNLFPSFLGYWLISYALADLSMLGELAGSLTKSYTFTNFSKPVKPIDNAMYSDTYEPALYLSPVRNRYITMGDNSAIAEIPDSMYIHRIFNKFTPSIVLNERISFSAISAYCYFEIGDNRARSNVEGFALIKPNLIGDVISDAWQNYVVQQRDSDRAMMWTNILTGGLSEAGSTAVSAGIGWRSNTERAIAMDNSAAFADTQSKYYGGFNRTKGSSRHMRSPSQKQFYANLANVELRPDAKMYRGMARNAMFMSGIGGVTAFSANAIHQGMAQRMKEKSIQNKPGTLAKSGNAIASIIDNQYKFYYMETIVDTVSYEKYKMLFMKFGYYIGGIELPNIISRKYFNYIKTNGAILTGSCNNQLLSHLANIFDAGVTIWHMDYNSYETIYDYTRENIERSLM